MPELLRMLVYTVLALAVTLLAPRIVPLPPEVGTLHWRASVEVRHCRTLPSPAQSKRWAWSSPR